MDLYSENGKRDQGHAITLEMDGSEPDCPISFVFDGKPVFSLGADEVDEFTKAIESLVP